jgi:hypothetical protein
VQLTREIGEFDTLLAIDRAKQIIGYIPAHSWRDHIQNPLSRTVPADSPTSSTGPRPRGRRLRPRATAYARNRHPYRKYHLKAGRGCRDYVWKVKTFFIG